ncbi:MAG TPA: hypothetical protein VHK91_13105 [Flavisolibacter sp.]|jgi:hypothetical protein|nr:hypothetical protein [Flavisolibacter sp.]
MRLLLVAFSCWAAMLASAQNNTATTAIDSVISRLYSRLSIAAGDSLHFHPLAALFDSGATLSPAFMPKEVRWSVEAYVTGSNQNLRTQQIQTWQERELHAQTDVFGTIAQRFSTYEIRFTTAGKEVIRRGINAIQLVQRNGSWRVHSIIWDREREGLSLPDSLKQR